MGRKKWWRGGLELLLLLFVFFHGILSDGDVGKDYPIPSKICLRHPLYGSTFFTQYYTLSDALEYFTFINQLITRSSVISPVYMLHINLYKPIIC